MTEKAELVLGIYDFYIPPLYRGRKRVKITLPGDGDAEDTTFLSIPKRASLLTTHLDAMEPRLYFCTDLGHNISSRKINPQTAAWLSEGLGAIFPPTYLLFGSRHEIGIKDHLVEVICRMEDSEHLGKFCLCAACRRTDHCESDPDIAPGHCGECVGPVTECDPQRPY